jgi:hypothetical protein
MKNLFGFFSGRAFRPDLFDWRAPLNYNRLRKERVLFINYQESRRYLLAVAQFRNSNSPVTLSHSIRHDLRDDRAEPFSKVVTDYCRTHKLTNVVIGFVPEDLEVIDNSGIRYDGNVEEFHAHVSLNPDVLPNGGGVLRENSLVSLINHPDPSIESSVAFVSQSGDELKGVLEALKKNGLHILKVDFLMAALFRSVTYESYYRNDWYGDVYLHDGTNATSFAIRDKEWALPESLHFVSNLASEPEDPELGLYAVWNEGKEVIATSVSKGASETALYSSCTTRDPLEALKNNLRYKRAQSFSSAAPCSDAVFDASANSDWPASYDINPKLPDFTNHYRKKFAPLGHLSTAAALFLFLFTAFGVLTALSNGRKIQKLQAETQSIQAETRSLESKKQEALILNEQVQDVQDWVATKPNLQAHLYTLLKDVPGDCSINRFEFTYDAQTRRLSVEIEVVGVQSSATRFFSAFVSYMEEQNFSRLDGTTTLNDGLDQSRTYRGVFVNRTGVDA